MRCRFFILVLFTTVVQSSRGIQTTISERIQTEMMTDYLTAHPFKKTVYLEYQKCIMRHDSTNVTPQSEDGILAVFAAIDDAQEIARCRIIMLISLTYATINITSANIADGNECGSNVDESITEIAARKEVIASTSAIDAYFNSTVLVEPRAISAVNCVRNKTFCLVMKLYGDMKVAIELAGKKNPTQIPAKIESLQKSGVSAAITITENIFVPIINASKYHPQTKPVIKRLRERTVSLIEKAYTTMFIAIKILILQAFPKFRLGGANCFPSIGAAETYTFSVYMEAFDNIFIAIRNILTASPKNQIEMVEDFCSCAYTSRRTKLF